MLLAGQRARLGEPRETLWSSALALTGERQYMS